MTANPYNSQQLIDEIETAYKNPSSFECRRNIATALTRQLLVFLSRDNGFKPPQVLHYYRIKTSESLDIKLQKNKNKKNYYEEGLTDVIGITFVVTDYELLGKVIKRIVGRVMVVNNNKLNDNEIIKFEPVELEIRNIKSSLKSSLKIKIDSVNLYEIVAYLDNKIIYEKKKVLWKNLKRYEKYHPMLPVLKNVYEKISEKEFQIEKDVLNKAVVKGKDNEYAGVHLIFKLNFKILSDKGAELFQGSEYAEIQFKTVAQNIWSVLQHDDYDKNKKQSVPKSDFKLLGTVTQLLDQVIAVILKKQKQNKLRKQK